MPANLFRDAYLPCDWLQDLCTQAVRPERCFAEGPVTTEDPVSWLWIPAYWKPSLQPLHNDVVKRHRLFGYLGLAWPDGAIRVRPKNIRRPGSEADILPLQAEDFANPQAGCGTDRSHKSFPIWQRSQQSTKLLCRQHVRPPQTLRADPHHRNRVLTAEEFRTQLAALPD